MKYLNYKNKIDRSSSKILMLLCVCFILVNFSCSDDNCEYTSEVEAVDTFPFACNEGMDVVFLVDYSRSMFSGIESIKSSATQITNAIVSQSGGNYRLGLSIFDISNFEPIYLTQEDYVNLPADQKIVNANSDMYDHYLTTMEKFGTNNLTSFSSQLDKLNGTLSGGAGNFATEVEPGGLLFNEILNNNFAGTWRAANITKLAVIITDSQAGGEDNIPNGTDDAYLLSLANNANSQGVQVVLVSTLATSNFEISLLDNNTGGIKSMNATMDNLGQEIINLIETVCVNNEG